MLARSKLKISEALINNEINHEDFTMKKKAMRTKKNY